MDKQHKKLAKCLQNAEDCLSRKKAQKIIQKAEKIHQKIANQQ